MELMTTAFLVSALVSSAVYRGFESQFVFLGDGVMLSDLLVSLYIHHFLFPFCCCSYLFDIFA